MSGLCEYAPSAEPLPEFGAKVYKIARDPQGNRLTYLKVTGGQLRVKDVPLRQNNHVQEGQSDPKVFGRKIRTRSNSFRREVCAVTGLEGTYPGQGSARRKNLCFLY